MTVRTPSKTSEGTGQSPARQAVLSGLPVQERRLTLAGVSTAILEGGAGPPIVLLHGPGEYGAKWMRVLPALVRSHRVVAPDLPAHGGSAVPDAPIERSHIIAWLDELIARTCSTEPLLVGQIIGGAIAACFASEHSDRLDGLVLVDALGLAPFQPMPEFGKALMEFVTRPTGDTHDALWQRCAFDLDRLRDGMGKRWTQLRAYNLDRALSPELGPAQQQLMELFGLPAIPERDLANITASTTLIWGRHDLATPLGVAQAASADFGWPLHVIEEAADDPPIEQPDAFVRILHRILRNGIPTMEGNSQ